MNDLIIRKATIDDLNIIINLNNKLFELEKENFDDTLIKDWPLTDKGKEYFTDLISNNYVVLGIVDNNVVGYLAGCINEKGSYEEIQYGEINNMYIDSNYRQYGIGRKLFQSFKQYCLENNINNLKVTASAKNVNAINFYKRLGFENFNITLTSQLTIEVNNYIIIHGSFGSKDGNWFPWLKEQLKLNGKQVVVPQMPIGVENQNCENWSNVLNGLDINENTIIIAHSIAPIFVCKYLITNKIKVKKLIFVCGFNNYLGINPDFDIVNKPMYIDNYVDVKKYCSDITCFYSDNDPYVKFEVEKEFADTISNKQYVVKNGGHINSETGYTKFEEILKEIF